MRQGIFLPGSTSSAVSVQPPCAIACTNICAHVKNPKHTAIQLFEHAKILHTSIGMGSAALAAAVPYPGKATRISSKGQISTLKKKIFLIKK